MLPNDKPVLGYTDGSEMWRDNAVSYGIDEAINISHSYLDLNLKREHSEEERQLCSEMFTAMYFATVDRVNPNKLIYPFDLETANKRTESSYYHLNRLHNSTCVRGIDELISASCYKTNFYNLEIAAMIAIMDYGFPRVCSVLAFHYQCNSGDGRLSAVNREWANGFIVCHEAFNRVHLQIHATLIDGFCGYIRELYQRLGQSGLSCQEKRSKANLTMILKSKEQLPHLMTAKDFLLVMLLLTIQNVVINGSAGSSLSGKVNAILIGACMQMMNKP